jgi:2-hydroxychromene-2-carboxylate isomerase
VSDDAVLTSVLDTAGFNGADLLARANAPGPKAALRALTAEAKQLGICGVPTYRVLRQDASQEWTPVGGLVWGQDEAGVLEDLIAGWDGEAEVAVAGVRTVGSGSKKAARL